MATINLTVTSGEPVVLGLSIPGIQGPPGLGLPSGGTINEVAFKLSDASYDVSWSKLTHEMIGDLRIANDDIDANARIADTKLDTIVTTGKVSNTATTATSAALPSTIVSRDGSGGFVAGSVTVTGLTILNNFSIDRDLTVGKNLVVDSGTTLQDAVVSGDLGVSGVTTVEDLVVLNSYTVSGLTASIDALTLTIQDNNIEIGNVGSPSDVTADGGGITLKGATDKTIAWQNSSDNWQFSEGISVSSGKAYHVNNVEVLSASALGSGVQIASSNMQSVDFGSIA